MSQNKISRLIFFKIVKLALRICSRIWPWNYIKTLVFLLNFVHADRAVVSTLFACNYKQRCVRRCEQTCIFVVQLFMLFRLTWKLLRNAHALEEI